MLAQSSDVSLINKPLRSPFPAGDEAVLALHGSKTDTDKARVFENATPMTVLLISGGVAVVIGAATAFFFALKRRSRQHVGRSTAEAEVAPVVQEVRSAGETAEREADEKERVTTEAETPQADEHTCLLQQPLPSEQEGRAEATQSEPEQKAGETAEREAEENQHRDRRLPPRTGSHGLALPNGDAPFHCLQPDASEGE